MKRTQRLIFSLLMAVLPAGSLQADEAKPGLPTVMFENIQFLRPTGLKYMDQINVDTGYKVNDYSRIWVGRIVFPTTGKVEITAEADDGLRLTIDGHKTIDGWGKNTPRSGTFQAERARSYPFRLDYYQDGGEGYIRLYWSWDGQPRELIPASAFLHTPEDVKEAERIMAAGGAIAPEPVPPAPPETPDKSFIYQPGQKYPGPAQDAVDVATGPQLFVDDFLIESASGVTRQVVQPARDSNIPNPIVDARRDKSFQPYMTVSRSPETGRFRIWYGISTPDRDASASRLAYMESDDGIHFDRPHRVAEMGHLQFGSEVLDRGPYWPDASQRYVYSHWYGGLRLEVSPDGMRFRPLVDRPLIAHNHDINSIAYDSLRQRYVATMSTFTQHPRFKGARRTTMQSFSANLIDWSPPQFVLVADDAFDEGQTQFYAMEGFINRGPLRIGMVKILRDDLFSDESDVLKARGGDFGTGYTTLAWTRDGEHWVRDRETFFDRGRVGSWDRSHAWIDEQLIVGEQIYLYYGGYRSGHKANRFEERQIGLVRMPLDRYVARRAGATAGTLLTIPLRLDARPRALTLNTDASGGEIRAQLRDASTGAVVQGCGFDECVSITTNSLAAAVLWGDEAATRSKLDQLRGKTVRLELQFRDAAVYAFEFAESAGAAE